MAGALADSSSKILDYIVHGCSSFLSTYVPENIQENKPGDQTSRWSSDTNNPPQYLILKLHRCAIIKNITFGKYEKTHVCNLKKFKILGGLQENNLVKLMEGGLKNDSTAETFTLTHLVEGQPLPCQYLKIVPLQSWGPSFNFSVWFVELRGIDDPVMVLPVAQFFQEYREREAIRLCLKHFRQRGASMQAVFDALKACSGVTLEDPRLSVLHDIFVLNGDYTAAENFMQQAVEEGLLDQYLHSQDYTPSWSRIMVQHPEEVAEEDEGVAPQQPGMRGGHQMCMDPAAETIFLFGGWDGTQDLSDLWQYHTPSKQWTRLSSNTEAQGGPSARSCHKMCLDPKRRQIFTLGRYLDTQYRSIEQVKSDFYVYDIETGRWTLITEDTAAVGGPQLIFDHQICMDVENSTIYVFGGRVLTPTPGVVDDQRPGCRTDAGYNTPAGAVPVNNGSGSLGNDTVFSGLYAFHVPTSMWTKLCDDSAVPFTLAAAGVSAPIIRSRVGHSMLFHPGLRVLFVFAGQRSREYLNDFFAFNVDTHEVRVIWDGGAGCLVGKSLLASSPNVPATGYTQRATIDPDLNEIYVLSGLSKDKEKRDDNVQNSFWVYFIKENYWSCVYRNENTGEQYWNKMQYLEPCPRFAHQLVYDPVNKLHYLFGGNPGKPRPPKLRLDDFWQLRLCRPNRNQLLHRCQLMIRRHRFKELAGENSFEALTYLQTSLSEIIDHSDPEESREFQLLAKELFRDPGTDIGDLENGVLVGAHQSRSQLFDQLSAFFPDDLTQPRSNLVDLLPL